MATISGYEILDKVRQNHNMETYRALNMEDKSHVLLKIPSTINPSPSSENLAILQHEYYLLNKINAPEIIKAYDFIHNPNQPVLILEPVEGQLFSTYLKVNLLELSDFFTLALQLVDIVEELHLFKIIHKEIKPSNIIINPEKLKLKLIDLSASTKLSEELFDYQNVSKFVDDVAYISPEQTGRINRRVDYRTDFYSLGVTLYEMLTSQLPFQTQDNVELIYSHVAKKPPSVLLARRNVPKMLAAIIEKLLEKMPEDRYSSVKGIKADLHECYKHWIIKRNDNEYSLGSNDIKDHLNISRSLYGREEQIQQLMQAFDRVGGGSKELVFVAGYSGIGKTSLVKEVYKPLTEHRGYYIQGKFDQLQRGKPYNAIVAAFQNLVKQVLSESDTRLEVLRNQLISSLGAVGQVVIDVIPEVELIIGKQSAVPILNPIDTQIRFNLVFQNFVRVFAQADHPLVIFLDDLQWADNSSLNFIENLLQDRETKYLLILGAYRDNEISEHHPLQISINNLAKNGAKFSTLTLQPLKLADIEQLLEDALSKSIDKIEKFAQYVLDKTQGNPFFINVFLKLIYQENLLTFSYISRSWEWNLEKIEQNSATDNVLSLLRAKIQLLSIPTQETLKLAACIGHQFNFKTLLVINGQSYSETAAQLWQAISANLIYPLEEPYKTLGLINLNEYPDEEGFATLNYKFAHDKIQQATYELIAEQDRLSFHLKIGRLLLKQKPLEENEERLFLVLKHFNQSLALINDPEERQLLAKYNYWASQKAKSASAYYVANEHLVAGIECLKPNNWKKNYNLLFQLYKEFAVCKYLVGDFAIAEQYFSELLQHSLSALDNLEIYRLQIEMLSTLGKHDEALELGLKALSDFKINIPRKPKSLHIVAAVFKIKFQLRKTKIEDINLPPMVDAQQKAIVNLITQLFNSAFITNQKLFVLLTCKNISLSLKYGYTESTSTCIPVYAFVIMHSLNLYNDAISFVTLYNRLKHEYGASNFEGKNQFVLGTFIEPYQISIDACNDTVNNAFELCCNVGDLVYSNYSKLLLVIHSISRGKSLEEAKQNIQSCLTFMLRVNISDFINIVRFLDYSIQCLQNVELAKVEEFTLFEEKIINGKSKTELSLLYSLMTRLHFVLGNYEEAISIGEKYECYSDYDKGMISHLDGKFFFALALFNQLPLVSKTKRTSYLRKLKKIHLYIGKYANWCPDNYKAYSLLLDCEFARLEHRLEPALALYEQTIKIALSSGLILIAAIASERAALHCVEINLDRMAKFYMNNAERYFKEWGALSKVALLEQTYPKLVSASSSSNTAIAPIALEQIANSSNMDMLAILKFTQDLSTEIRLDKLLQKLSRIALEVTGAQRCIILSKFDNQWVVEAAGDLKRQTSYLSNSLVLESLPKYPIAILNCVESTQEPLIFNSDSPTGLNFQDPYMKQSAPQSLLMIPLSHQGQLCRMLYLENTVSGDNFTLSQLNSIKLLASQTISSLENAKQFYQATHDHLTGLPNKNMLYEWFESTTKQISRTEKELYILVLNLDSLSEINSSFGANTRDKVLVQVTNMLTENLREGDYIARMDGDEFVIMLTNISSSPQIIDITGRLFKLLSKPIQINDHTLEIVTNIGVSVFPKNGNDIQILIQLADNALAQSKEKGKNQCHFYSK